MTLPFAMKGRLSECLLLSYRTPARSVRHLVPGTMDLVTRDGWAFWNVLACRVEGLRPAGAPACLGVDFRHVAYRLHVKARTAEGNTLDGLYFVRSDADKRRVRRLGNLLTPFRFNAAGVELSAAKRDGAEVLTVAVTGRDDAAANDALLRVEAGAGIEPVWQPGTGSPFDSADDAGRFLKYRPLAIGPDLDGRYLELAEVVRDESKWRERPVRVLEAHFKFLRRLGQDELHLERATRVDPIEYRWRLGRRAAVAPPQAVAPATGRPAPAVRAAA
jgi:hypothetical protein